MPQKGARRPRTHLALMLVNTVTYTFPPERADDVAEILRELRAASQGEPGCVRFEVCRGNDDPSVFVLYETWRDAAALEAHYASEHFARLGINGIRPLALTRAALLATPIA